jgi:ABC-type lipoprotein release transport system permease subunit
MNYTVMILIFRLFFFNSTERILRITNFFIILLIVITTATILSAVILVSSLHNALESHMKGVHPDIIITLDQNSEQDENDILKIVEQMKEVSAASLRADTIIFVQNHAYRMPTLGHLIAVDFEKEQQSSTIFHCITPSPSSFQNLDNSLVLGTKLAELLEVIPGEKIELLLELNRGWFRKQLSWKEYQVTVAGVCCTGVDEIDSSLLLCPHTLFKKLFHSHPFVEIAVAVKKECAKGPVIEHINAQTKGVRAHSWIDDYPSFASALNIENYVTLSIVCLILLLGTVAVSSITAAHIAHHRTKIALLHIFGIQKNQLLGYLLSGIVVQTMIGILIGTGLSLSVLSVMKMHTPQIIKQFYQTPQLTISVNLSVCIVLLIIIMAAILLSTSLMLRFLQKRDAARSIKFDL